MLTPQLTIQGALGQIGQILSHETTILDKDSVAVQAYKNGLFKIKELFQRQIIQLTETGIEQTSPHNAKDIEEFKILQSKSLEILVTFSEIQKIPADYSLPNRFTLKFNELIYNAIEHGTDFCQNGNVRVDCIYGETGALCITSQNQPGINQLEAINKMQKRINRYKKESMPRGFGLTFSQELTPQESIQIWFRFQTQINPTFSAFIFTPNARPIQPEEILSIQD